MASLTVTGTELGAAARPERSARGEKENPMSARIVLNLAHGLAECAVDRAPDGGTWLSLRQGPELVIVKLSAPSLAALQLALAQEPEMLTKGLEMATGNAAAPAPGGCR